MAAYEPIDPRVRLAIAQWPDDAPRGAVSTFCAEHGISRKSFYVLRKRATADGPAAVLEPGQVRRHRAGRKRFLAAWTKKGSSGLGRGASAFSVAFQAVVGVTRPGSPWWGRSVL